VCGREREKLGMNDKSFFDFNYMMQVERRDPFLWSDLYPAISENSFREGDRQILMCEWICSGGICTQKMESYEIHNLFRIWRGMPVAVGLYDRD